MLETIIGGALFGGAIGGAYYLWQKRNTPKPVERNPREFIDSFSDDHYRPAAPMESPRVNAYRPIVAPNAVRPSNPWATPRQVEVSRLPQVEYEGRTYHRDDHGRFYNANGTMVRDIAIGAALGGLATYMFTRPSIAAPSTGGWDSTGFKDTSPGTYDSIPDVSKMGGRGSDPFSLDGPAPSVDFSRPAPSRPAMEEESVRDRDIGGYGSGVTEERAPSWGGVQEERQASYSPQVEERTERYSAPVEEREERVNSVVEESYSSSSDTSSSSSSSSSSDE